MSENEQTGSKVEPLRHEDDFERRLWCRVVRKCIPRMGMSRAVHAADAAVLALRERSVASAVHPATGSAYEQLVQAYRALEKQRDDMAREARACFEETIGLSEQRGNLKATIIAMRKGLERLNGELVVARQSYLAELMLAKQVAEELRAEKAALLVERERLCHRLERLEAELDKGGMP